MDGHAAVLAAHTVSEPHLVNKSNHIDRIKFAAHKIKSAGKQLNPEMIKIELNLGSLKLKSSHPDALKNLHANLMKVKSNECDSSASDLGAMPASGVKRKKKKTVTAKEVLEYFNRI